MFDIRKTKITETSRSRIRLAIIALVVFVSGTYAQSVLQYFDFYNALYQKYPFYVPETFKSVLQILLCVGALTFTYRSGVRESFKELALDAPVLRAFLFALVASSPMLIGFALTRNIDTNLSVPKLLYIDIIAPFAEEILFRGYTFRQLYRRANWSFWIAVIVTAVAFGLGHIEKGTAPAQMAGLFFITGIEAPSFHGFWSSGIVCGCHLRYIL